MAAYEWVLNTPRFKEFERTQTRVVESDEPVLSETGVWGTKKVKTEVTERVTVEAPVDRARLSAVHNDVNHHRLFVRFYYGRIENGQFAAPILDDGVVFGGPTYLEHEFHENPSALEELALLNKIAAVLKWDGQARQLPTAP